MRFADNFNPEWGYLAPAPSFLRTTRIVLVAVAIGATAGGAVVFSLVDHPAAEETSVAARTLVEPAERTKPQTVVQEQRPSVQPQPQASAQAGRGVDSQCGRPRARILGRRWAIRVRRCRRRRNLPVWLRAQPRRRRMSRHSLRSMTLQPRTRRSHRRSSSRSNNSNRQLRAAFPRPSSCRTSPAPRSRCCVRSPRHEATELAHTARPPRCAMFDGQQCACKAAAALVAMRPFPINEGFADPNVSCLLCALRTGNREGRSKCLRSSFTCWKAVTLSRSARWSRTSRPQSSRISARRQISYGVAGRDGEKLEGQGRRPVQRYGPPLAHFSGKSGYRFSERECDKARKRIPVRPQRNVLLVSVLEETCPRIWSEGLVYWRTPHLRLASASCAHLCRWNLAHAGAVNFPRCVAQFFLLQCSISLIIAPR